MYRLIIQHVSSIIFLTRRKCTVLSPSYNSFLSFSVHGMHPKRVTTKTTIHRTYLQLIKTGIFVNGICVDGHIRLLKMGSVTFAR